MKNVKLYPIYSLLFALFLIPFQSQAQSEFKDSRFGVKGGLNLSSLYTTDINERTPRIGFHAGIFTEFAVGEFVSIQPELLLTTKGNTNVYQGAQNANDIINAQGEAEIALTYIEVPLLFKVALGEVVNLHVGPYASYLIRADTSLDSDIASALGGDVNRDQFNDWDFGLAVGLGVDIGAVTVGARYNRGLVEVAQSNAASSLLGSGRNAVLQAYVAVGF